jgi:transposase
MNRGDLTAQQWELLRLFLPPEKPRGRGRPNKDHRTIVNGILWILRTGSPWRDLPERYGSWSTVANRFYRWRKRGVWTKLLEALARDADAQGRLNWEIHYVDSTVIRAHQHAAGAKGGTQRSKLLGAAKVDSLPKFTYVPRVMGSPLSLS